MIRITALLALSFLLIAASPPKQNTNAHQTSSNQNVSPALPAAAASKPQNPVQSSIYKAPCADPKNNDQCALQAQWEAAQAGRDAAYWARWQTILSGLGIMGLLVSLYFTRIATLAAASANRDAEAALAVAERNADALSDQVSVTRVSAERELRAYVGIESIEVKPASDDWFAAKIRIKNYGKTPAQRCVISTAATVENWPTVQPNFDEAEFLTQGSDLSLQPSAETLGWAGCSAKGKIADIQNQISALYIFGRIHYVDIEGHERITKFAYRGTGGVFLRTNELQPCTGGNNAD